MYESIVKLKDWVSRRYESILNVLSVDFVMNESTVNVGVDLLINIESTFDNTPEAVELMIGIISCK